MRNATSALLPFVASGLFLAAATAGPASATDPEFGRSVRQNIEVQTVDMDPKYKGTLMEGGVGRRSAAAVSRYMTDQIRPLRTISGKAEVGSQAGGATSTSTNTPSGGN